MKRIMSIFFAFFLTIACIISGGVLLSSYDGSQFPSSSVSDEKDEKGKEEDEEQISAQANATLYSSSAYDMGPYTVSTTFIVGQKYILELSLTGSISNYGSAAIVIDSIKNDRNDVDWSDRKASCEISLADLNSQKSKKTYFIATSTEAGSCDKVNLWYATNGASPNLSQATINIKVSKADPVYVNFDATNIWQGYSSSLINCSAEKYEYIYENYYATICRFTEGGQGVYFAKERLTEGETYVWSVQIKSTHSHAVDIGHEQGGAMSATINSNWQTITHEFVANNSGYNAFIVYNNFVSGEVLNVRGLTIQKKSSISFSQAVATRVTWYGETYGSLPSVSKTGCSFDGWYTALNGGTKVTSSTSMTKTADHILYARFIKKAEVPSRTQFDFYSNGGNLVGPGNYQIGDISLTYYGYGFMPNSKGWLESQNKGVHNSYSMVKIRFSANQTGTNNSFTIRYISYGESNYDYAIFSNLDQTLTEDYNADGTYYKRTYGESSASEKSITYSNISSGYHTIYVKFRKDSSNHSYNDSLQLFFESDILRSSDGKYQFQGLMYGTLPTATKTGNRFDGWWTSATGGTRVTENSVYNGNSVYAHWVPNDYQVTYNANGGTLTQEAKKTVIESGFVSSQTYTLEKGVATPTLRSNYMNLTQGKGYGVSFTYWTDSGTQEFNVDFYPDTLPQLSALKADTTKRTYDWAINLNHSNASSCQVRFFHDFGVENSVHISNIVVYEATPGTAISTGYSESQVYSLETGVSVPTLRSNSLNLTNGATYRVSFCYWTDSGSQTFQIDFYPDTLPETSATADTTKRTFNWIVTLNHADANSCVLRFFHGISVSNTVHISNIKLYALDTPYQGATTYRNMSYGTPYASAPYSDNIPVATREYYEFKGWYTAASGGTKVLSTNTYSIAGNQTLYAQWEPVKIVVRVHLRLINMDGSYSNADNANGGYVNVAWYLPVTDLNGNSKYTEAEQNNPMSGWNAHQGQQFKITATANSGYAFVGFSTSSTPSDTIKNPKTKPTSTISFYPTSSVEYYVYFKQLSGNQLQYDETEKYFYFEDGYYPQSEAVEEMICIEDYQKNWRGVETTYYVGQRYFLDVSLEGTISNYEKIAIVIDAVKKGNDDVDFNDRQTWCEVELSHLMAEKHVRLSFTATSNTVNNCDSLLLWYAYNGNNSVDFSNAKIKVKVLRTIGHTLESQSTSTGETISFNNGSENIDVPIYSYNAEKYAKVTARGETRWFKFEPIRWRISDYGVAKTERNIQRYTTLYNLRNYTSYASNFTAVSDLILGVGAMHNTRDVREGDSVQDMMGFQNIQNITDGLTLNCNFASSGNVINIDNYSTYTQGNSINKDGTLSYSSPFRICSLAELESVGFVNKQAKASDMVAFILGVDNDKVSYWTRDLSNLGAGVAISATGTQVRPWLDQMLGMRFAYTFKEGSNADFA